MPQQQQQKSSSKFSSSDAQKDESMASCLITKLFQPKHSTIKQLTRGRKVGFTGTIAVLDGRTRTG